MPSRKKYIFVVGGVISGLGKGIITSAIGRVLKEYGMKVTAIKIDPYLNWDAGTMNPLQHGEVFVLNDGGEVDQDLGNYERFMDIDLNFNHNITTGKVYYSVIQKERKGEYLGSTVQIIPHITDEIKGRIRKVAKKSNAEIVLVEIGGTVGDIESMPFIEAARQMALEEGKENVMFILVTPILYLKTTRELKTKPTQHSAKELREAGIQPDMIICRTPMTLKREHVKKISLFTNVPEEAVISAEDVDNIYQVPLRLHEQGVGEYILKRFKVKPRKSPDFSDWRRFLRGCEGERGEVRIAIVGKYAGLKDAYISVIEAIRHAGAAISVRGVAEIVSSEEVEKEGSTALSEYDGIIVPGGFGARGTEGKIEAIRYARENKIPFLGICFGFQLCVVEYARNVLGLKRANTTEVDPETPYPVVDLMPEQREIERKGGTMRLGEEKVIIKEGTMAHRLYGKREIYERHRHRYEVNPEYIKRLEEKGLRFSGTDESGRRMEILEVYNGSFFMASQFHPEFKSRPMKPAPLFLGLVKWAYKEKYGEEIP